MQEEITIERMLIVALLFCMGLRYVRIAWNGRSVVLEGEKPSLDEKDE
jgi:hypothetical protein